MLLRKPRAEQGFTLVELLVVIIIIGILAAIAIPVFLNQRQRANEAALKADIKTVAQAMDEAMLSTDAVSLTISDEDRTARRGWTVIVRGKDGANFAGSVGGDQTAVGGPEGFPGVNVSAGSAVGAVTNGTTTTGAHQFCVAGNAANSKFEAPTDSAVPSAERWLQTMYYDSQFGSIYAGKDLPLGGACKNYAAVIATILP